MDGKDYGFEALLNLHGEVYAVGRPDAGFTVSFKANRVPVSKERPHGLNYSFVLHDAKNERIAGFDNAHAVEGREQFDHKHRFKTIRPYDYADAEKLLIDFYELVDSVLKETGGL